MQGSVRGGRDSAGGRVDVAEVKVLLVAVMAVVGVVMGGSDGTG